MNRKCAFVPAFVLALAAAASADPIDDVAAWIQKSGIKNGSKDYTVDELRKIYYLRLTGKIADDDLALLSNLATLQNLDLSTEGTTAKGLEKL